ncbi:hypothetical protein L873DRAFT_1769406 [Choiromyces venosus 120613-1]|uniref:Cytochrome P450 n=1 Tax=Choiromyces venosus 120613-1 TaxID=1336337 RepID=A0A3N4JJS3_9PEZI|nr:hypothetical protein L873DRAFT_1769406 [Choiromyces venosus 120613-1]
MSLLDPYHQATIAASAAFLTQQVLSPIPEVSTTKSILFYTIANGLLALALKRAGVGILYFFMHMTLINFSYLTSLTFFTIVHRLYFHPLSNFPGNKVARLSKLYEAWLNYNGMNGPVVRDLCRKHGDFIRTGPNELAINNAEAVEIIWGRTQPTARGPFYEFANFVGEKHLASQRNKAIHASWRRIWDKGFTSQTVVSYSPRVEHHVDKMISILEKLNGKETNFFFLLNPWSYS